MNSLAAMADVLVRPAHVDAPLAVKPTAQPNPEKHKAQPRPQKPEESIEQVWARRALQPRRLSTLRQAIETATPRRLKQLYAGALCRLLTCQDDLKAIEARLHALEPSA